MTLPRYNVQSWCYAMVLPLKRTPSGMQLFATAGWSIFIL